jgi:hypothetical protein
MYVELLSLLSHTTIDLLPDPSVYPFVIPYPSHCASGCKIDPTPDCDAGVSHLLFS